MQMKVTLLNLDVWWGWLNGPQFREIVKRRWPWIRLWYVGAACTCAPHHGQFLDGGIIAMAKALMRGYNGQRLTYSVIQQLLQDKKRPSEIKLPLGLTELKQNMVLEGAQWHALPPSVVERVAE